MFLGRKKNQTQQKSRIEELEKEVTSLNAKLVRSNEDLSRDRYLIQKAFEISGVAYWMMPVDKSMVTLSQKAQEILSLKKENTFSEFLERIHPGDASLFEKQINTLIRDKESVEFECRLRAGDNDTKEASLCYAKAAYTSDPDMKQDGIIGFLNPALYLEKIRKELAKANEKEEESERSKNSLLATISREIRTPINSIIGFSELLNIGKLDFDKRKYYVKTIRNQGTLLLKFVDDITELIKFESGKVKIVKSRCNLNLLLKEIMMVAEKHKKALNKEYLEIRLELPDKTGLVISTDPGRLQQVIANLISNSIEFTEKGTIEFGHLIPSDGKIEFFVRDTGVGLTKEEQKNVFSRFPDEEMDIKKYESSGLGLTLSKYLVKLLGGRIWVESEPGKGSVFRFTVPYEQAPADHHESVSAEEEEYPRFVWKDKVILIVEDDEVNFRFTEALLHDSEAQLLHASNGLQAVELCRSISKIDLVLMDIKMPEMDGLEATRQIRQFNKKIPVIAQTAFIMEIDPDKCLAIGCNAVVAKPIDIKEFLEKINDFLKE
jgi:signal transduction histidine kinase